jgi:hypothetical protein
MEVRYMGTYGFLAGRREFGFGWSQRLPAEQVA